MLIMELRGRLQGESVEKFLGRLITGDHVEAFERETRIRRTLVGNSWCQHLYTGNDCPNALAV